MRSRLALLILLLSPQTAAFSQNWEQIRSTAERQHEMVMLLIRNGDFGRVLEASKQIFSLRFPVSQEHLLVQEGRILSEALGQHQQFKLAHGLLDQAFRAVQSNPSKIDLFKEKAYIYTKQGRDKEAMKFFERALELEKSSP
jgi:tetratricopeptide (TPR) repeat protein